MGGTEDKEAACAQTHPKLRVPGEAVIEEMVSGPVHALEGRVI